MKQRDLLYRLALLLLRLLHLSEYRGRFHVNDLLRSMFNCYPVILSACVQLALSVRSYLAILMLQLLGFRAAGLELVSYGELIV